MEPIRDFVDPDGTMTEAFWDYIKEHELLPKIREKSGEYEKIFIHMVARRVTKRENAVVPRVICKHGDEKHRLELKIHGVKNKSSCFQV